MSEQRGPTATLAEWVSATRWEDLPEEVRQEAVTMLYDQVGGMLPSSLLVACEPVIEAVGRLGGPGECTIIGHPGRAPLLNAALANGAIGHSNEVDATSVHGAGHVAAPTVSTTLTMGEYVGASGKELIRALALGAEVTARMHSTVNNYDGGRPEFYYSFGAMLGAAVTAGTLLGLDAKQMEHAVGAAAFGAAPLASLHREELHQTKALAYSGRPARTGVEAAVLAQHGFHAPREILTEQHGFFDAFVGNRDLGHTAVEGLGETFVMRDVLYKRYSVGGPNQAALHTFLQLIKKHNFTAEDIERIEVSVSTNPTEATRINKHPSVYVETVLSLAAVFGEFTYSHAHDMKYVEDPRVVAFLEREPIVQVPRTKSNSRSGRLTTGLLVRLKVGTEYREESKYPLMTQDEIQHKFRNLAGLRLEHDDVMKLERDLLAVESMEDVSPLVKQLGMPVPDVVEWR